jgi:hypothetical protein
VREEEIMIYDNEARSLCARERADLLASEMRRARRLTPEEAGYPSWTRLAAELLRRAERRLGRRNDYHAPAYDA